MPLQFKVTDVEIASLRKKLDDHAKKAKGCRNVNPKYKDSMEGASLVYQFTNTGAGTRVDVICSCGKKFDVSDYESW